MSGCPEQPAVTVLVVTGGFPEHVEAALRPVADRHVASASAGVAAIADESPVAAVVDRRSLGADADSVVDAAWSATLLVPVVLVAEADAGPVLRAVDARVTPPVDPDHLVEAVERAALLGEYDATVEALYDRAQERPSGEDGDGDADADGPDLHRLRRDADELLDDLVAMGSPELLGGLLAEIDDEPSGDQ